MIKKKIQKELTNHRGVKWFICVKVRMVKSSPGGQDQVAHPHFRSIVCSSLHESDLEQQYTNAIEKIKSSFLKYQREGSGWILDEVRIIHHFLLSFSLLLPPFFFFFFFQ